MGGCILSLTNWKHLFFGIGKMQIMKARAMPEKNKPIRGTDAQIIAQIGYAGNIPLSAVKELEQEAAGLIHGIATLTIHVKDGKLTRYVASRERSFIPGRPTTGVANEF
jgi:hypothetical protein